MHDTMETLRADPTEKFIGREKGHPIHSALVLTERTFINMLRHAGFYWLRLAMYILLTICLGTIYVNLGTSYQDVFNRFAILFFSVAFLTFMAIAAVPAFIEDMKIAVRERLNGEEGGWPAMTDRHHSFCVAYRLG